MQALVPTSPSSTYYLPHCYKGGLECSSAGFPDNVEPWVLKIASLRKSTDMRPPKGKASSVRIDLWGALVALFLCFANSLERRCKKEKKDFWFMHCSLKVSCTYSVHWHILTTSRRWGLQCAFHFLLITQRKPMTSLALGAENCFLINQNDFSSVSQENYIVKSRWACTSHHGGNATKWGSSLRRGLLFSGQRCLPVETPQRPRYITVVTLEDNRESERQEWVGSLVFAAVGATAGLLQAGNGQVDKWKRLQRPRGRAQTLL